jgi:hypothetical protein
MTIYSNQPTSQSGKNFDAGISTNNPGGEYLATSLPIGNPASGSYKGHGIVCFDLSSINPRAVLISAYISLWVSNNNANGPDTNYGNRVKQDWLNQYVNWWGYNQTNGWAIQGGTGSTDIDTTAACSCYVPQNPTLNTEFQHTFDSTGLSELKKIIDGTYPNYGYLFHHAIEDSGHANKHNWHSIETGSGDSYKPKMVVEYYVPSQGVIMMCKEWVKKYRDLLGQGAVDLSKQPLLNI